MAENVLIGALHAERKMAAARIWADEVLALVGLAPKAVQKAGTLTLPERKCLEVARALATRPKLLLLDEAMAGLRPNETDQMVAIFRRLNQETGLSILLVEHVMRAVMALSHRVVVINSGRFLCEGVPAEVVKDPRVYRLFPRLAERHSQRAGTLSGGEQQMLAIGRCLMGLPRLIMFDEPSLGLAPAVVKEMFAIIEGLHRDGTTVLLVEQNVVHSLKIAHAAVLLENGLVAMTGTGAGLLADDRVRQAYLGL